MTDSLHGDPRFQALLGEFDREALGNDSATVFGLWPDLALALFNSGWFKFAAANGGEPKISAQWPIGRCLLEAIAEPLRPFFMENYGRCLQQGRPWEHAYECSSPEVYRQFHMTAFPLGRAEGLLVVNSVRLEVAHLRAACPPLEELYRNREGIVVQCCHCRRVRRARGPNVWDWVPAWLTSQPENTSHGLCEPCMAFHYSEQRSKSGEIVDPFKTWI